jgi:hypothetical protein
LTGAATATNPAAAVAVVSPGAGAAGTNVNVVITGNGWTNFSPASVITFVDTNSATYAADITVSSFTEISPNQINATLTLAGGGGVVYGARNIKVTTPLTAGGTETAQLLSAFIIADPSLEHTITAVSPAFGSQGQTLTVNLTAAGTNFVQGTTFANFGDGITVDHHQQHHAHRLSHHHHGHGRRVCHVGAYATKQSHLPDRAQQRHVRQPQSQFRAPGIRRTSFLNGNRNSFPAECDHRFNRQCDGRRCHRHQPHDGHRADRCAATGGARH